MALTGSGCRHRTDRTNAASKKSASGKRGTVVAWVIISLAILEGCGKEPGSDSGAEDQALTALKGETPTLEQVCSLLKPAEVAAVLDRKVGKPHEPPPLRIAAGMRACEFGDLEVGQVTVGLSSAFAPQVFDKAVAKLKGDGVALVPVQNLGDEAVAFFGGWLLVRTDPYVLFLGVKRLQPPFSPTEAAPLAVREANIELALKVLNRLPQRTTATGEMSHVSPLAP